METLEKKKFETLQHNFAKNSQNLLDLHEKLKIKVGS
jgi:hypothetical protein